jgi:hypothetical protein
MKASNSQQKSAPRAFKPKPLTVEQESAIDALLTGKSDREAAEIAGCSRWAVQGWRTSHPLFMATLHQRREELFSGAVDRLRSLLGKALDNIEAAIQSNSSTKWSFELLRAVGLYGFVPPTGELNVQKLFDDQVMRLLAQEKIPGQLDSLLIKLGDNPEKRQREAEIRDELTAEYGDIS